MKKIILTILAVFLCSPAFAENQIKLVQINAASGPAISAFPLLGISLVTSGPIYQGDSNVVGGLAVDVSAGSVNISTQVSNDGTNWYFPNTTDGTTLTSTSSVVVSLTSSKWIILTTKLSRYVRFTFYSNTGTTSGITAKYFYQFTK